MELEVREKGPVETLCREIGWAGLTRHGGAFDMRLERADLFVAFVRVLVNEIEHIREMQSTIAGFTKGKSPSDGSAEVLAMAHAMLGANSREDMIAAAARLHNRARDLNSEDAYPTDHLIDMLSSCASAIRFGLEEPCRSCHAAEAASHIWDKKYGVTLFDSFTPNWKHDWMRAQVQSAITSLMRQE
jgi:hypothetical protein